MSEQIILGIITGGVASGVIAGAITLIQFLVTRADEKKKNNTQKITEAIEELRQQLETIKNSNDLQSKMLLTLGHDKICWLGKQFLKQKEIDSVNYASLKNIYMAYAALGGNSEAHKIWQEIEKLPISEEL